jgi:hypothetical protein
MGDTNQYTCQWKMIDPSKFTMGINAERCGATAVVRILRPSRKTDLFLCEHHVNAFIDHWGLHYNIEVLCNPESGLLENSSLCTDVNCKKCLQDEPKTWRHR